MQLKKGNTIYYFAVPLQGIKVDKYNIAIPEQYGFCSPAFRQMVEEEKLSGFEFEIANIE